MAERIQRRRRRGPRRRRRRIETGVLFRALSTALIFACVFGALIMFFRVKTVAVTGEWLYSPAQIQSAAGIADGDNLFFLNKYTMRDRILSALPYVEQVRISRELPDTLHIDIRECRTPLAFVQDGGAWLMNTDGVLIDRVEESTTWARVTGCTLLAPSLGEPIALDTDFAVKEESLLALVAALREAGMLAEVNALRLEDPACMRMEFAGRFTVKLPWSADYRLKLRSLDKLVSDEKIQENMTGVFDLTRDDKNYFQPDL